jgi:hypothetical protein
MLFKDIEEIVDDLRDNGVPIPRYYDRIKDELAYDTRTISDLFKVDIKNARAWFNPGLKHGCLISTSLSKSVAKGRDLKEWAWIKDEAKMVQACKGRPIRMDFMSIVTMIKKRKGIE